MTDGYVYERKVPHDAPLTELELLTIGAHKASRLEIDVRSRGGVEDAIRLIEQHLAMVKADLTATEGDRPAVSSLHSILHVLGRNLKALGITERKAWEDRVASARNQGTLVSLNAQNKQVSRA